MKLNIANPATGQQKTVEIDDEKKLIPFMEKRMGAEVPGDTLGDEFAGYIFRITGGNDKQGFPMMQGVICNHRVRLLFRKGMKCFRPRRKGYLKRKSVRGCIVGSDLAVMSLVLAQKGKEDIPGLTDEAKPRRLGPKRASKIRKLFNLSKEDDVRQYVVRRVIEREGKKPRKKAPKIQRLVTPRRIHHKKYLVTLRKRQLERQAVARDEYKKLLQKYHETVKSEAEAKKEAKNVRKSTK